jgi:hypothetical protein
VKGVVNQTFTIWTLAFALLLVQIAPGSAHGWAYHHHHWRHARMTYAEYSSDYGACRVGWWQALRYGHVRPVWATWCR